jgi:hypothetical protein
MPDSSSAWEASNSPISRTSALSPASSTSTRDDDRRTITYPRLNHKADHRGIDERLGKIDHESSVGCVGGGDRPFDRSDRRDIVLAA